MRSPTPTDGNTAAADLAEAFGGEMTAAPATCAACGVRRPLAMALVYSGGPGSVLRCSTCSAVLMRIARIHSRLVLDAGGVRDLGQRSAESRL